MTDVHHRRAIEVQRGMPEHERVLQLLNTAYDEWGTAADLRWTYDMYPGFDPKHVFYIERDGTLAAFRRVFWKELSVGGRTVPATVLGDTAVAPDHRGEGLYSELHAATVEYCREAGAHYALTFNRTNNVTFEANRKRGWQHHTLPLYLLVGSQARALARYAHRVLADGTRLDRAFSALKDRVALAVDGESVPLSALRDGGVSSAETELVDVPVPASVVTRLVSAASKREPGRMVSALIRPTADRPPLSRRESPAGVTVRTVTDPNAVDPGRLHEISAASAADAPISFRRAGRDVQHLLAFPHDTRALVAERDGRPCGDAIVGIRRGNSFTEARVLEMSAADREIFLELVDAIERIAEANDHDATLLCSRTPPGGEWIPIDKQVVMWYDLNGRRGTHERRDGWRIGFYDIE